MIRSHEDLICLYSEASGALLYFLLETETCLLILLRWFLIALLHFTLGLYVLY